jgi:hypothetical protein
MAILFLLLGVEIPKSELQEVEMLDEGSVGEGSEVATSTVEESARV